MSSAHQTLVAAQFGPRARAYVDSPDHATGADLARLAALVSAKPGGCVLDLGCGGGHVSYAVARFARKVVAYDLSSEMLAAVEAVAIERGFDNIQVEQGPAAALPFCDASFDFVFTRFSAHHWFDLKAGLTEMRRVLTPAGKAVVVDTVSPGTPASHDTFLQTIELLRDPSHVRDYSLREWDMALRAAGLRPKPPICSRLRLDFAAWVARIGTPEPQVDAIRALARLMPSDIQTRFAIAADGSFTLDTAFIEAEIEAEAA